MSGPEPLGVVLARMREVLVDGDALVRAVASGRRRGLTPPPWRRVEVRPVDLRAGRHLQVTRFDDTQAHTANHAIGDDAGAAVDALLAEPFGHWHVESVTAVHQVRVTKRGDALLHTRARTEPVAPERGHDREKQRLLELDPSDPLLHALGLTDEQGRVRPSRRAKLRQVEEFLRLLDSAVSDARSAGHLRRPTDDDPLRVVDLGCGNAYLTFAAHRLLTDVRGLPVRMTGVDVKEQSREHNTDVAARAGLDAERVGFVTGTIDGVELPERPDVVLALHACDTATDEALARAVAWEAPLVLAAPCCHHDVAAQLRRAETPAAYGSIVRHGILRERFADTLTDAVREMLLRLEGYRVDVVEFVDSAHTPRNTLLRAVRTGARPDPALRGEYDALVAQWGVQPRLADLLAAVPRDA